MFGLVARVPWYSHADATTLGEGKHVFGFVFDREFGNPSNEMVLRHVESEQPTQPAVQQKCENGHVVARFREHVEFVSITNTSSYSYITLIPMQQMRQLSHLAIILPKKRGKTRQMRDIGH